jgi:hypothetical protein
MTVTESPPASPEVAEAEARLAAIDPTLVSPALRAVTLQAARTATFRREAVEHVTVCQDAVQGALAAGDANLARQYATDLEGAERMLSMLPAVADDDSAAPCLAKAREKLDLAASVLPQVPTLSSVAELAAFKSLAPTISVSVDPPSVTAEDRILAVAVDSWASRRQTILSGIASWKRAAALGMNGALDLLAQVGGLWETCREVCRDGAELQAHVDEANRARAKSGDEWVQASARNSTVAAYSTPEIRALQRHRAGMAQ